MPGFEFRISALGIWELGYGTGDNKGIIGIRCRDYAGLGFRVFGSGLSRTFSSGYIVTVVEAL